MASLLYILALIPLTIWNAFGLTIMWSWFAVPLGAPEVGVAHMIGIVFLVSWLTGPQKPKDKTNDEMVESVVYAALYPVVGLFFGYVTTLFV